MRQLLLLVLAATTLLSAARPAAATETAPTPAAEKAPEAPPAPDGEAPAEGEAAPQLPHLEGPRLVDLGHGVEVELPAGTQLYEKDVAQAILRQSGDAYEDVLAMITREGVDWTIWVEYGDIGHVTDDDADELDADDLLQSYREGAIEQNKQRKAMGSSELFVDSWNEPPRYDRSHRHLLWGINAHSTDGKVVNHFTRILGRQAVVSVNLIASPEELDKAKAETADIIKAIRFKPGFRYDDFNEATDKSSGIGLSGLIMGGAGVAVAKKAGILAVIFKFLLGAKKILILGGIAVAAFARKLFGRKDEAARE